MQPILESELTPFAGEQGTIADDPRRIVIVDGIVTSAPAGATIRFEEPSATYAEHFDPLYYLSHALSPRTIVIDPEESPSIEIHHRYTRPDALIAYRIAIQTAPNTSVQVYESFFDAEAKGSVILYGIDASIARDATLHWVKNQTLGTVHSRVLASHFAQTETNAMLDMSTFDFGSGQGLATVDVILGDYAVSQMHHFLYATESARRGIVSRVIHRGHHAHSTQQAKNILRHHARGIFDALIKVEHSAPKTIAHQNNQAILLDDGAYMASKPQLEIYIDDLEASHGSTTGQLDEKALFYLRSRGIAEEEARKMLILAFANTLIDRIEDTVLREWIHQSFEAVYYGQTHIECIATCHGCEEQTAGNA
jgi:Fe-S cluster assembly protein SufD